MTKYTCVAGQSLSDLPMHTRVMVETVVGDHKDDAIAHRLSDLGFVAGEYVSVVARAPFGGDPMVVQVGFTRFALRRAEAARIKVNIGAFAAL